MRQPSSAVMNELSDESGSGSFSWVSFGLAVLLFFSMACLEVLMYQLTGYGFLLP
jgi:hypothetical protein